MAGRVLAKRSWRRRRFCGRTCAARSSRRCSTIPPESGKLAEAGISLQEPEARAMVQIAAIPGMGGERAAIERVLGADLPGIQRSTVAEGASVLWTGPDQWWVLAARERGPEVVRALEDKAAG